MASFLCKSKLKPFLSTIFSISAISPHQSLTPDSHLDRLIFSKAILKLSESNYYEGIREFLNELQTRPDLKTERFVSHCMVLYGEAGILGDAVKVFGEMPLRNNMSWKLHAKCSTKCLRRIWFPGICGFLCSEKWVLCSEKWCVSAEDDVVGMISCSLSEMLTIRGAVQDQVGLHSLPLLSVLQDPYPPKSLFSNCHQLFDYDPKAPQ